MSGVQAFRRGAAKRFRAEMTPAEVRIWRHLSRIETIDTHFRRQIVIGPYIADFACLRARLIIEIDGDHHGHDRQRSRDEARSRWLRTQGFRVLRFWNGDVLEEIESVLDTIHAALYGHAFAQPRSFSRTRASSENRSATLPMDRVGPTDRPEMAPVAEK